MNKWYLSDSNGSISSQSMGENELRNLGCFTTTSFSYDNQCRMLGNFFEESES